MLDEVEISPVLHKVTGAKGEVLKVNYVRIFYLNF